MGLIKILLIAMLMIGSVSEIALAQELITVASCRATPSSGNQDYATNIPLGLNAEKDLLWSSTELRMSAGKVVVDSDAWLAGSGETKLNDALIAYTIPTDHIEPGSGLVFNLPQDLLNQKQFKGWVDVLDPEVDVKISIDTSSPSVNHLDCHTLKAWET